MVIQNSGPRLEILSPAKLNLFLEITGRRSDGYHELETLMVTVDLFDHLLFTEDASGQIRLQITDARQPATGTRKSEPTGSAEALPVDESNLIIRAARLLQQRAGLTSGADIRLTKRIPVAAGLAGGSGNAAATLISLNRLWNAGLSADELGALAAELGSDIGFFITGGGAAVCRGRGELVQPVPLPSGLHLVLVRPPAGLSTALVYRHCRPSPAPQASGRLVQSLLQGRLHEAGGLLHNALQPPAEALCPEVAQLNQRLARMPVAGHRMSGSGSTCFALCRNRRSARQVAGILKSEQAGMVQVVRTCSWPVGVSSQPAGSCR